MRSSRPASATRRRARSACSADRVMPTTSTPYRSRGVQRQAAPAAADVEQPHAGREAQLAADQVELGHLGGVQPGALVGPDGARVDQRGPEDECVEVVADVVVVGDRGGVPAGGVPPHPGRPGELLGGRGGRGADRAQGHAGARQRQPLPGGGPGEGGGRGQPADARSGRPASSKTSSPGRCRRPRRPGRDRARRGPTSAGAGPAGSGRPGRGASLGPASDPSQARSRQGRSWAPRTVLTAAPRRAATPSALVHPRLVSAGSPIRVQGPGDRVLLRVRTARCAPRPARRGRPR